MAAEIGPARTTPLPRKLRPEDAPAAAEILRQAPAAVFWSEQSIKEVLEWQGVLGLVSEIGTRVVGFLIGRQAGDQAEILNLAIAPGNRRTGQGSAILKAALDEFRSRGVSRVFLEVRESNAPAIAFYKRLGFSPAGKRDGYYRDPKEAALVMEISLTSERITG